MKIDRVSGALLMILLALLAALLLELCSSPVLAKPPTKEAQTAPKIQDEARHTMAVEKAYASVFAHLGISQEEQARMSSVAKVEVEVVLTAVARGDARTLEDWSRELYQHRLGQTSLTGAELHKDKKHPFHGMEHLRLQELATILLEHSQALLLSARRCEADFLNRHRTQTIYRIGRHSDQKCVDRMLRRAGPGSYSGGYHDFAQRTCFEQSADPKKREQLISDFAFVMDVLLLNHFTEVYANTCNVGKPPRR